MTLQANKRNERSPKVVTVTVEMATELLEHNQLNRPLNHAHVARIAGQIIDGKWKFNGDTIKVADSGDVLDGQHRLWAVLEAKRPIETIIVYGIEKDAFSTIDTLRKPRSGGDVLALAGATRYRSMTAMALKWLILWQRGKIVEWQAPANRIENSDIEQAFADNPAMIQAVERTMQLRGTANPSTFGFLYYRFFNRNPELADRMIDTLVNPAGIGMSDPFYVLRHWLLHEQKFRKDPLSVMAVTIKAANAAYEGRSIRSLFWKRQGQTPEPFPKLHIVKLFRNGPD